MDNRTSLRYELITASCGLIFLVLFVPFFGLVGKNLPQPPSATLGPGEIAGRFTQNLGMFGLAWVICLIAIALYAPWTAQISNQLSRIETRSRALTYTQLISGALTFFVVSGALIFWAGASFRATRDPQLVQLLSDLGWLALDLQWAITTVQMVAIGLLGLADKREQPLFPSWACWLSIWCGVSFAPASLVLFLKSGPFSWNGLLAFYIPYTCWLGWCAITSVFMIKDVRRRIRAADHATIAEAPVSAARPERPAASQT